MLFLASRVLEHEPNRDGRLRLLARLQEKNLTPLIRSTRLNFYKRALPNTATVEEMERLVNTMAESGGQDSTLQGDLFCFEDHVFFLLFEGLASRPGALRAGIVYEARTSEPLRKLDSFCQTISLCLAEAGEESIETAAREVEEETGWRPGDLHRVVTFQPAIGIADSPHDVFLGHGAERVGEPSDVTEAEVVSWVPVSDLPKLINEGRIRDGASLVAVLHLLASGSGA